jgi:hypothetical protein
MRTLTLTIDSDELAERLLAQLAATPGVAVVADAPFLPHPHEAEALRQGLADANASRTRDWEAIKAEFPLWHGR